MVQELDQIPKIIHYCWFGGKPLPSNLQECLDSWKLLEGYEVKRWDESNCNFDENEFVRKSYNEKQLGFIGDYYRLKALYNYGGIYLDTDVKVYKTFDSLLHYPVFLNFIYDSAIGSAIIGSRPKSPFIKKLLDMYDATIFSKEKCTQIFNWFDGKLMVNDYATSNYYYTYFVLKHYPNFRLNNRFQNMGDFVIFPKELFEIGTLTGRHYAIHLCAGEWRAQGHKTFSVKEGIKRILRHFPWLYDKMRIIIRKNRYMRGNRRIPFYAYQQAQEQNQPLPDF